MSDFWTKEREIKAIEMWNAGLTAQAITEAIGAMSRNAVIGKLRRMGVANRGQSKNRIYKTSSTPHDKPKKEQQKPKQNINSKTLYMIVFKSGEYAHLGGVDLTSKEVYSWKGTREQARNLISHNPLYRRKEFDLVSIGKPPLRAPLNRY